MIRIILFVAISFLYAQMSFTGNTETRIGERSSGYYYNETLINLKNNIYSSYDLYIGQKYEVEINYQTLDRLKNYLR